MFVTRQVVQILWELGTCVATTANFTASTQNRYFRHEDTCHHTSARHAARTIISLGFQTSFPKTSATTAEEWCPKTSSECGKTKSVVDPAKTQKQMIVREYCSKASLLVSEMLQTFPSQKPACERMPPTTWAGALRENTNQAPARKALPSPRWFTPTKVGRWLSAQSSHWRKKRRFEMMRQDDVAARALENLTSSAALETPSSKRDLSTPVITTIG